MTCPIGKHLQVTCYMCGQPAMAGYNGVHACQACISKYTAQMLACRHCGGKIAWAPLPPPFAGKVELNHFACPTCNGLLCHPCWEKVAPKPEPKSPLSAKQQLLVEALAQEFHLNVDKLEQSVLEAIGEAVIPTEPTWAQGGKGGTKKAPMSPAEQDMLEKKIIDNLKEAGASKQQVGFTVLGLTPKVVCHHCGGTSGEVKAHCPGCGYGVHQGCLGTHCPNVPSPVKTKLQQTLENLKENVEIWGKEVIPPAAGIGDSKFVTTIAMPGPPPPASTLGKKVQPFQVQDYFQVWGLEKLDLTQAASDYYVATYLALESGKAEHEEMRVAIVAKLADQLGRYLVMACGGELRHALSASSLGVTTNPSVPKEIKALFKGHGIKPLPKERHAAWKQWAEFSAGIGMSKAMRGAQAVFELHGWSASFGGKKWGQIAKVAADYLEGKLSPTLFVDSVLGIQHNGGIAFNKAQAHGIWSMNGLQGILDAGRKACDGSLGGEEALNTLVENCSPEVRAAGMAFFGPLKQAAPGTYSATPKMSVSDFYLAGVCAHCGKELGSKHQKYLKPCISCGKPFGSGCGTCNKV